MALLSIASLLIANAVYYFGPSIFLPPPGCEQPVLYLSFAPAVKGRTDLLHLIVFVLMALSVVLLLLQIPFLGKGRTYARQFMINCVLVLASFSLIGSCTDGYRLLLRSTGGEPAQTSGRSGT